jgi:DNA-directed RNA polymerase subunit F
MSALKTLEDNAIASAQAIQIMRERIAQRKLQSAHARESLLTYVSQVFDAEDAANDMLEDSSKK